MELRDVWKEEKGVGVHVRGGSFGPVSFRLSPIQKPGVRLRERRDDVQMTVADVGGIFFFALWCAWVLCSGCVVTAFFHTWALAFFVSVVLD